MREYTPERLRHLTLLAEKYPTALSAYSEIIRLEALLRLPKGTEHFMSDLHGEHEAFIHILNSASGVIREKIDRLLGDTTPPEERADLATLIYYPREKLPELKARQNDLDGWYQRVLLQLIDLCRLVSSKHTRRHVRAVCPRSAVTFSTSCSTHTSRITTRNSIMAKSLRVCCAMGWRISTSSPCARW